MGKCNDKHGVKRSVYAKSLENPKYRHKVIPNKKKSYKPKLKEWEDEATD